MLVRVLLFFLIAHSASAFDEQGPSSKTCDYYLALETKLKCGSDSYLMADAHPLCEKYKSFSPWMTSELQKWFPEVRYCLQAELHAVEENLTCQNIDQIAVKTHVDCYVRTGYCDLSMTSRSQLALVTLPKMFDSLWVQTAEGILQACRSLQESH